MERKYELIPDQNDFASGTQVFRIRALRDIPPRVKAGDIGGYIEDDSNLSHEGDCWVFGDAMVWGNAYVCDNAKIFDRSMVFCNAIVSGSAEIYGISEISGDAHIGGDITVYSFEAYKDADITKSSDVVCIPVENAYDIATFFKLRNKNDLGLKTSFYRGTVKDFKHCLDKGYIYLKNPDDYRNACDKAERQFRIGGQTNGNH